MSIFTFLYFYSFIYTHFYIFICLYFYRFIFLYFDIFMFLCFYINNIYIIATLSAYAIIQVLYPWDAISFSRSFWSTGMETQQSLEEYLCSPFLLALSYPRLTKLRFVNIKWMKFTKIDYREWYEKTATNFRLSFLNRS